MSSRKHWPWVLGLFLLAAISAQAQQRISEDRELKELDLTGWDCLNQPDGSAKTTDGAERNRGKNRSGDELPPAAPEMDTAAFLKHVSAFESQTKGKRRKDLTQAQQEQLIALEKQVVSLTAYLVIAYAGPPETTNCGSVDFHDWHLELFEKPSDHAPQVGDPTPIICEITPRTQTRLFRDGVRLQALAGFFRGPDLTVEPTGHAAQRIKLTGYLLWDDDHNGKADIGTTILKTGRNGYHQPWRSTAWEIHPVLRIQALDSAAGSSAPASTAPATAATATPVVPVAATPPAPLAPTPAKFITIVEPVKVKIQYGETVLPRGMRLPLISQDAETVTVTYMSTTLRLPRQSTDLR